MEKPSVETVAPPCKNLRCKEMFYDPNFRHDMSGNSNAVYWCVHTQDALGPDKLAVDVQECAAGRECYER